MTVCFASCLLPLYLEGQILDCLLVENICLNASMVATVDCRVVLVQAFLVTTYFLFGLRCIRIKEEDYKDIVGVKQAYIL